MPAMLGKRFVDQLLRVGIGGAAQRQRDGTERQLEQPVPAPRLKVIMPLGRRSRDKFDLAFIEPEALIGRARLSIDLPVGGAQDTLCADFADCRDNTAVLYLRTRVSVANAQHVVF